jgi:hypothetical protein
LEPPPSAVLIYGSKTLQNPVANHDGARDGTTAVTPTDGPCNAIPNSKRAEWHF